MTDPAVRKLAVIIPDGKLRALYISSAPEHFTLVIQFTLVRLLPDKDILLSLVFIKGSAVRSDFVTHLWQQMMSGISTFVEFGVPESQSHSIIEY